MFAIQVAGISDLHSCMVGPVIFRVQGASGAKTGVVKDAVAMVTEP